MKVPPCPLKVPPCHPILIYLCTPIFNKNKFAQKKMFTVNDIRLNSSIKLAQTLLFYATIRPPLRSGRISIFYKDCYKNSSTTILMKQKESKTSVTKHFNCNRSFIIQFFRTYFLCRSIIVHNTIFRYLYRCIIKV